MKKFAVVLLSTIAMSSAAQAEGFRAEIHGGYDYVKASGLGHDDGATYGLGLGYDAPIGGSMFAGVEANIDDSTIDGAGRDLSANVRIGSNIGDSGKLYALVGYTNQRAVGTNGDGVRAGVGYEHSFGTMTYGKVEYRYSNYEAGVTRHQTLLGVGVRF